MQVGEEMPRKRSNGGGFMGEESACTVRMSSELVGLVSVRDSSSCSENVCLQSRVH